MTNNEDYANLLEIYADIIRVSEYELSKEQKEMIKKLGETLLERTDISLRADKISDKKNSIKILENSSFELIRRNKIKQKNKQALEKSNIKLARSIGKEPGE